MAMAASPFILLFWPVRSSSTAQTIVTGSMRTIWFESFKTVAMDMAPNATCERPSPM